MNKIISKQQYKLLVGEAKRNNCKLSNCFFFPADIDQRIQDGVLYYHNINKGLLLFENRGSFYRCYFYLDRDEPQRQLTIDKDAVIEIPFTNEITDNQRTQITRVEEMGFHLGRKSGMMAASPDKVAITNTNLCQIADEKDSSQISQMLIESFNPLYSYLSEMAELKKKIKTGRVFVIKKDEEVCGVLLSSFENNIASINQVVVRKEYRGKGYGNLLLSFYHSFYLDKAKIFQHWVDLNNKNATSMYCKNGYVFTSRKANEYILLNGGI